MATKTRRKGRSTRDAAKTLDTTREQLAEIRSLQKEVAPYLTEVPAEDRAGVIVDAQHEALVSYLAELGVIDRLEYKTRIFQVLLKKLRPESEQETT